MYIPENNNNSENTITIEESENNLYDRLLQKKDTTTEIIETETDSELQLQSTDSDKVYSTEEKKRFKKLNTLGANGLVTVIDIGVANFANYVAMSNDASQFRANDEDLENLKELIEEVIPKPKSGAELKIPLWVQLLMFFAIAFVPILFKAFNDREQNRLIAEQKKQLRKVKFQMRALKMEKEKLLLEQELMKNKAEFEKQNNTEITDNQEIKN